MTHPESYAVAVAMRGIYKLSKATLETLKVEYPNADVVLVQSLEDFHSQCIETLSTAIDIAEREES